MFVSNNLPLVARRVAFFLDSQGINSDLGEELFSAGCECLVTLNNQQPSQAYLSKAIDRAIVKAWQRDRLLAVPPSTRYDRIKNGDAPGDFTRHSWGEVFGLDTQHGTTGLLSHCPPHWQDAEEQWLASVDPWLEVVECYEQLFSCCRDDLDRRIVEVRMGAGLTPAILQDGFLPTHVADVGKIVGLSARSVQRRLDRIQNRYSKSTGFRFATHRQRQRQPA